MGGTSACCVEKDPIYDTKLAKEASNNARSTHSTIKYTPIDNEADGINSSIDHSQNGKRGSIIHMQIMIKQVRIKQIMNMIVNYPKILVQEIHMNLIIILVMKYLKIIIIQCQHKKLIIHKRG